jgi:hypothetical protein
MERRRIADLKSNTAEAARENNFEFFVLLYTVKQLRKICILVKILLN